MEHMLQCATSFIKDATTLLLNILNSRYFALDNFCIYLLKKLNGTNHRK
jgi:hypothetical protein